METRARAHKQTDLPRQPSKKYSTEADVSHIVTCSRIHQGMDPDGLENGCSPQKSHQRSQSTGCLGEESTDESSHSQATVRHQHHRSKTEGTSKVVRDGVSNTRQGVNVKSTWPGCEVELGTCHCLPYYVLSHTRPMEGHRRRQRGILCGGDPPRGLSDETTSLGTMITAMERKPTPALQVL